MGWSLKNLFWASNGKPVRVKSFGNFIKDARYTFPKNKVKSKGGGWQNLIAELVNTALKNKK